MPDFIDWLIDWSIHDWLIDWSIHWLFDWLIDFLLFFFNICMIILHLFLQILMNTKELIEKLDLEVIYGDTDSVMINTRSTDYDRVMQIGAEVCFRWCSVFPSPPSLPPPPKFRSLPLNRIYWLVVVCVCGIGQSQGGQALQVAEAGCRRGVPVASAAAEKKVRRLDCLEEGREDAVPSGVEGPRYRPQGLVDAGSRHGPVSHFHHSIHKEIFTKKAKMWFQFQNISMKNEQN